MGTQGSVLAWVMVFLAMTLVTPRAWGDSANYYYDDLGRLTRVVKGTQGSIYLYDELGNILSVSSTTAATAAPVLTSINPNVLFVGESLYVRITGQNLLTTGSVTSDNPALTIGNLFVNDTEITAVMTATAGGSATVTVTTAYGSSGLGLTVSGSTLKLAPGQLALVPGTSSTLTATIDPPLTDPLTINLLNSKPSVTAVPATVTIPVNGTANFSVSGLQNGVSTVSAGHVNSVVFVEEPFSGEVSGLVGGKVSVYIEDSADAPTIYQTNSVSVYLEDTTDSPAVSMAGPVSVYLEDSLNDSSTTPSRPVSVQIQP